MSVLFLDPRVERHLIADEGEVIVDEVRKHWAAAFGPILELLAIIPVVLLLGWLPSGATGFRCSPPWRCSLHSLWRMLAVRMDRFVVTNMRVFRVHGILSQHVATMPISRILDISVHTPIIGRIFNYGHFVFESAAQEQGSARSASSAPPDQRGLTIQRVIQRSGLRGGGGRPQNRPAAQPPRYPPAGDHPELTQTAPIEVPWRRQDG